MWYRYYFRHTLYTYAVIVLLELLSLYAYFLADMQPVVLGFVGIAVFLIALKSLSMGFAILVAELIIDSKGHLFTADVGGVDISLRLVLFLAVFFAWSVVSLYKKRLSIRRTKLFLPFMGLLFVLMLEVMNAMLRNHPLTDIFLDANGYLFFGLLFVVPDALQKWDDVKKTLAVALGAWIATLTKTFGLLFVFSHAMQSEMSLLYRWTRVTGVAEITRTPDNAYRIFLQSHIYALPILFAVILYFAYRGVRPLEPKKFGMMLLATTAMAIILLSGSRSFWYAGIVSLGLLWAYLLVVERIGIKKIAASFSALLISVVFGFGLLQATVFFPFPHEQTITGASKLLRSRATTVDAASSSRFALLKPLVSASLEQPLIGQGFGTTITYATHDPRALENNEDGMYTTYSFEWGWLDVALKFGAVGTAVVLYLLLLIGKKALALYAISRGDLQKTVAGALAISVLSVAAIHALTPYVNHPLGIGILVLAAGVGLLPDNQKTS